MEETDEKRKKIHIQFFEIIFSVLARRRIDNLRPDFEILNCYKTASKLEFAHLWIRSYERLKYDQMSLTVFGESNRGVRFLNNYFCSILFIRFLLTKLRVF